MLEKNQILLYINIISSCKSTHIPPPTIDINLFNIQRLIKP